MRPYALVIGQCSPDLDSKLQGSDAFVQAEADQDVVQLLLVIRGYCCRFDNHQQSTYALQQAKHRVSMYYQTHDVTNTDTEYVEHFKALVGVVETYRGAYG
jgi:tRNA-dihydrouridine synthase